MTSSSLIRSSLSRIIESSSWWRDSISTRIRSRTLWRHKHVIIMLISKFIFSNLPSSKISFVFFVTFFSTFSTKFFQFVHFSVNEYNPTNIDCNKNNLKIKKIFLEKALILTVFKTKKLLFIYKKNWEIFVINIWYLLLNKFIENVYKKFWKFIF